ncbi:viridiflorene synthase-like [Coffea eugenioides]|uniref:viridiflorene synthase-like n=1 Tax=Coffea eugenioides TaxID=49369 RepID=UPI000F60C742|nr:viridiflorene synthase-like [Coffea eugenioides]
MASTQASFHSNSLQETVRPLAAFPENIWSDRIAPFTPDKEEHEMYEREIEMLKAEVNSTLLATGKTMMERFDFIDKIERLGVPHHFDIEIENQLQEFFNVYTNFGEYSAYDLSSAALQFRLFRQHGFNVSCGIFDQFTDAEGKFKESLCYDTRGLLSLYEASHVRTHGDEILEEALAFTTTHLTSGGPHLDSTPAKQVKYALEQPLHKGIPRYEAWRYISIYEEDESHNKVLLRLAKLDYHLLQMSYKEDLCEITRWGKELESVSKFPYARSRFVECYFWAVGALYEPQYSLARMTTAKAGAVLTMIDDIYDAYGTLDELQILTSSVESHILPACQSTVAGDFIRNSARSPRIDSQGVRIRLAQYQKQQIQEGTGCQCPKFRALLVPVEDEINELPQQWRTTEMLGLWKNYMRTSFTQSRWFFTNKLPSFADYLSNGAITIGAILVSSAALLYMDCALEDVINWLSTNPKLMAAYSTHMRLMNDFGGHKFDKERGSGTALECYMKDYNVSEEEAARKFREMWEDTWKVMNEECLRPTPIPRDVLKMLLNITRVSETVYKHRIDGFTQPHAIEDHIRAMLVDFMSI